MPVHRRVGNGVFVGLVQLLFGGHYSDLCYGYNAFWAGVVPLLHLDGNGFEIETMMNVRALQLGLKVAEVPSFEAERVYGEGRLRTLPDGWRVLTTIWREWASPTVRRVAPGSWRRQFEAALAPVRDEQASTRVPTPIHVVPVAQPVVALEAD